MRNSVSPKEAWLPELDGVRGLAIFLVIYEHYVPRSITGASWLAQVLLPTRAVGGIGVALFFVLSGFLIGGILMDHRHSENYFKSFYIRRCCRILPLYYLALALYVVVKSLLASHSSEDWFNELFLRGAMPFWANLTFTQNFVQVITHHCNPDWSMVNWSLVLEEQFYLVLPLALWLLRPSQLMIILLVLICLHPWCQLFLCIFHPVTYVNASGLFPSRADALFVGVICAHALRQDRLQTWLAGNRVRLNAVFVILLAGACWIAGVYDQSGLEYERIAIFDLWLTLFFAVLLLVSVTNSQGAVAACMRLPPLRWLGTISYAMYLFHVPVNGLMHGLILGRDDRFREISDVVVSAAAFAMTLLLATISWRFFEKPIIAWGRSFSYKDPKAPAS